MSESAALTTLLIILFIINIVGNSFVCAIIKRNRDMRTPINYLLLNLAVADMLYAAFITPNILFSKLSSIQYPDGAVGIVLCKLITSALIGWTGAASSIITLAAVAIERYYAVMYPRGNKGKLTKRKLKVIIPGIWIFSFLLNIPVPILAWTFDKKSNSCKFIWPEKLMTRPDPEDLKWNILTSLTLLVIVVMYSRVVYALWFKGNDGTQLSHQQKGVMKVRKRVTLMIATVSIIFGMCWGTSQVVYTLKYSASYNIGPVPIAIANTMGLFNAAVNPFVYALLNQQFREKMKRMICCPGSSTSRVHILRRNRRISSLPTVPPTRPTQQDPPTSGGIISSSNKSRSHRTRF